MNFKIVSQNETLFISNNSSSVFAFIKNLIYRKINKMKNRNYLFVASNKN